MQIIEYSDSLKFKSALSAFCDHAVVSGDVTSVVTSVLADVRERGDPQPLFAGASTSTIEVDAFR